MDALEERDLSSPSASIVGPWRWTGFVAALLIAASAPLWHLAGNEWRFTLPLLPHDGRRPFTPAVFLACTGVLTLSWVLLVRRVERSGAPERARTRAIVVTGALWFVPVLLGPPLLSSDVYSYAAQGEMVTKGLDPTSQGMSDLLTGGYVVRTDPLWRVPRVGNGYGPVQMGSTAIAVAVTNHDPNATIVLLRLLSVAGVALAGWGILRISRNSGLDPPTALALGIANPIVVLHVVGGAHNDGLLIGLLLAGIAVATRGRWWWGVALIAMAAAVKAPAIAALPFLAWCRPGWRATWRERVRSTVASCAAALGVIVAWSLVVGVSFGWINSMRNAGSTKDTLAITTQIGFIISEGLQSIGIPAITDWWVDGFRIGGTVLIAAIGAWLLWNSQRITPLRAAGLASLAMVLLGPVVWPWYLAATLALLAVTDLGRWRSSLMVLAGALACEVFPSSYGGKGAGGNHLFATLVIAAIAVIAVVLPWVPSWWANARARTAPRVALAD